MMGFKNTSFVVVVFAYVLHHLLYSTVLTQVILW